MGYKASVGISAVGLIFMMMGATGRLGAEVSVMGVTAGFVITAAGVILGFKSFQESGSRKREKTSDYPAMIRIVGGIIALFSLGMPYVKIPLTHNVERASYSLIDLVNAIQTGSEIQGGFILLLFMGLVLSGGFISFLHHVGGYIILLGGMAFTFIIMQSLDAGLMDIALNEFQPGLYIAIFAALVIIASSLFNPKTSSDTDWE
ncbi:MAG: hypothetical protein SXQ77_02260 [Halobacteria archaeon]|nr:hypothetical protein [Halobacteria archaeon]